MFDFKAIKLGIGIAILVIIALMGFYIKHQTNTIAELKSSYQISEQNNKTLNETIIKQNESIAISNAKYEEVQKQLDKANTLNKNLAKGFKNLRDDINNKPIAQTCDEAVSEMVSVGKKVGAKWKK